MQPVIGNFTGNQVTENRITTLYTTCGNVYKHLYFSYLMKYAETFRAYKHQFFIKAHSQMFIILATSMKNTSFLTHFNFVVMLFK